MTSNGPRAVKRNYLYCTLWHTERTSLPRVMEDNQN